MLESRTLGHGEPVEKPSRRLADGLEQSMRVITIEGFARCKPESSEYRGYIYSGDAWVFRFIIESEDLFFRHQLPNIIDVFEIDPRQIYKLVLYGSPGQGLYDVRLFVSFEEPPSESQLEELQLAAPNAETDNSDDRLDGLFIEFLKTETTAVKRKLREALRNHKPTGAGHRGRPPATGSYIHFGSRTAQYGSSVRVQWEDELSPRLADWSNANWMLAEALRSKYDPRKIVRMDFRAIPETEHLYSIGVDIVVEPPVRLCPIRALCKKAPPRPKGGLIGSTLVMTVASVDPMADLTEFDRGFRIEFNSLPLRDRIRFWQRNVARFFTSGAIKNLSHSLT